MATATNRCSNDTATPCVGDSTKRPMCWPRASTGSSTPCSGSSNPPGRRRSADRTCGRRAPLRSRRCDRCGAGPARPSSGSASKRASCNDSSSRSSSWATAITSAGRRPADGRLGHPVDPLDLRARRAGPTAGRPAPRRDRADDHCGHEQQQRGLDVVARVDGQRQVGLGVEEVERGDGRQCRDDPGGPAADGGHGDDDDHQAPAPRSSRRRSSGTAPGRRRHRRRPGRRPRCRSSGSSRNSAVSAPRRRSCAAGSMARTQPPCRRCGIGLHAVLAAPRSILPGLHAAVGSVWAGVPRSAAHFWVLGGPRPASRGAASMLVRTAATWDGSGIAVVQRVADHLAQRVELSGSSQRASRVRRGGPCRSCAAATTTPARSLPRLDPLATRA